MIKPIPYYPEVHTSVEGLDLVFSTVLRKECDGVWYQWPVSYTLVLSRHQTIVSGHYVDGLRKLGEQVYFAQVCGKVDTNVLDPQGRPLFTIDPLQIPESERIANLLNMSHFS